jgi:hypothetical protein
MQCGYISASRSGCAWRRSCWRPAPIVVSHKPPDSQIPRLALVCLVAVLIAL